MPAPNDLQSLCELGQQKLMATDYLAAEAALVRAEALALQQQDFDTLGRLYFPLQEARRQRRQVCGEGIVRLDLWALNADDHIDAHHILDHYPHGQLLVAGWADLTPALEVRRLAWEQNFYVETYLAAVYPLSEDVNRRVVALVPTADVALPPAEIALGGDIDALSRALPPFSILLTDAEVEKGPRHGRTDTFARTMALWERLHLPFLNAAADLKDPLRRIDAFRRTIEVDYACEKAHQWLAQTALDLARSQRQEKHNR